jgi:mRNA interferase MazF
MSYPRRGEIYLVKLPGHPSDTKNRPALVVSLDVRNRLANDVIVVPLSTNLRPAPTHVELPAGEGGLKETSMAKCEQVTTLDKTFLIRGPLRERLTSLLCEKSKKPSSVPLEYRSNRFTTHPKKHLPHHPNPPLQWGKILRCYF